LDEIVIQRHVMLN